MRKAQLFALWEQPLGMMQSAEYMSPYACLYCLHYAPCFKNEAQYLYQLPKDHFKMSSFFFKGNKAKKSCFLCYHKCLTRDQLLVFRA
ncbi:hypothetical protein XELAEV_18041713mg [Xenopus laevis]|uniref:Uncharacterized protein n=1 Tax=Xenopus laevis TaxID=8355 RepID=A0A974C2W1_XENLA|nr:hypothetical protein XELAEV_18041713mg [Xenopus laevis]